MMLYLGYQSGHGEVSFKIWITKGSSFLIDLWTNCWLSFKDKQIIYGPFNIIGSYEEEKWLTFKAQGDFNTTEHVYPSFINISIDEFKFDLEVYNNGHPLENFRVWVDNDPQNPHFSQKFREM